MKQILSLLLAAGALAGLLGGCVGEAGADASDGEPGPSDGSVMDETRERAEQVELYDGDGALLRTLTEQEEIDALFWAVADETGWDWTGADEPEAPESPVELTAVFAQKPTQTVLGPKVGDGDREEVLRLTLYEGSNVAELRLSVFAFHVELPDGARDALREAAGLDSAENEAA